MKNLQNYLTDDSGRDVKIGKIDGEDNSERKMKERDARGWELEGSDLKSLF